MKKRFLGILLSLCMALLLFPATALADDTSELQGLLSDPDIDKIVLERDYTISSTLDVSYPVTLDLNGHVIRMTGSDRVISITDELTLQDSAPEATHTGENASLPAGGVITNSNSGGGVYVSGSFIMNGGIIKDCYGASYGGGVYVSGSFTMTGGTISGCRGKSGSVYVKSNQTFFANGGEIKDKVQSYGQIRNTATDGGCTRFYGEVRNSSTSSGSGTISGGVYYGGIRADGGKVEDTYHTVSFQLNGGSGSAPTQWFVNIDTAPALRPADPTKGDLTFTGWYTDAALTKLYNFDSAVTENLILYAGFVQQLTVTYEFAHGTLADDRETPETVADGTVITLPDLENCGAYRLVGWQIKNSDDIDVYPVGEEYAVCDSMTFVAVYEEVPQLTVTYEFEHGSLADGRKTPETVGEDTTITLPDLEDCGAYRLTGWRVKSSDDTAIYSPGEKYVPKKNVTFVAVYESNATPNPGDGEIVETGDSRHPVLWLALLLICAVGLAGAAVYRKNER